MTDYGAARVDLPTYLGQQRQPMSPQQAALFGAALSEQLTALHAGGQVHGPLDTGLRVEVASGRPPQPLLAPPTAYHDAWLPADDVLGVGVILVHLLGMDLSHDHRLPPRPDGVPGSLWDLIAGCLEPDPAARPTAAVLAQQLRGTARDLLLGVAPWPSATPVVEAAGAEDELHLMVPGYVPGPRGDTPEDPARPPNRRARWLLVASTAAAVVLATVGVVFALASSADDRAPLASQTPAGTPSPATPTPSAPVSAPTTRRPTSAPAQPKKPRSPTRSPSRSAAVPAGPTVLCLPPDCPARVTFQPQDGHFTVCDNRKDGFSAIGIYTRSDVAGEKKVWASGTAGTCVDEGLGMPHGTKITFKACIGDHSANTVTACSESVTRPA